MKAGKSQENNHKPEGKNGNSLDGKELDTSGSPSGEDTIQQAIEKEIEEEKKILYSLLSPNALKGIEKQLQLTLKERAVYIELLKAELKGYQEGLKEQKKKFEEMINDTFKEFKPKSIFIMNFCNDLKQKLGEMK